MTSIAMLLVGYLVAQKATEDLKAFEPGPPRISDLLVFIVTLLMVLVIDAAFTLIITDPPPPVPCPPPCLVIEPV